MNRIEAHKQYRRILAQAKKDGSLHNTLRDMTRRDPFFRLYYILSIVPREIIDNDWVYDRTREVQHAPWGYIDLWFRAGFKTTVLTENGTIGNVLNDPNATTVIFSFNRPQAKKITQPIIHEFENNAMLKELFPEILWQDARKEAPKWNQDEGYVLRRRYNPKEPTIMSSGLVDGQPTGMHFKYLRYDDVETIETVRSVEMIEKTDEALKMSYNLDTPGASFKSWVGTIYAYNDIYLRMIKEGTAKPRIYPATKDGKLDGEPWLGTRQQLAERIKQMGPYVSACHCAGTKILMGDWSYKNIEDVKTGDMVVGFTIPNDSSKSELVATRVMATRVRKAEANRYTFESGHSTSCTPDHQWWTGRREPGREKYLALGNGVGKNGRKRGLIRISYNPPCPDNASAAWFSGMIDGEGCVNIPMKSIAISQSEAHNPAVVKRLREVMTTLGIEWRENEREARPGHQSAIHFSLKGGRPMRHAILLWHRPAKENAIVSTMFGTRITYNPTKLDLVKDVEPLGIQDVYALQTETGNYVANGYASKNCQLFLNPTADSNQSLLKDWLRYWSADRLNGLSIYILVDPASEKKKTSDYTVFTVVGLGADRCYYVIRQIRDRLNLKQKANVLFNLHQQYRPITVGYERYGMQADIEYIVEQMNLRNYRFPIIELGGTMPKNDRIKRMVPAFSEGRVYIPTNQPYVQYDGTTVDLTSVFVNDEYLAFPFSEHDDMLDSLSRIIDPELCAMFPQGEERDPLMLEMQEETFDILWSGLR